jgi:hypothetical protein
VLLERVQEWHGVTGGLGHTHPAVGSGDESRVAKERDSTNADISPDGLWAPGRFRTGAVRTYVAGPDQREAVGPDLVLALSPLPSDVHNIAKAGQCEQVCAAGMGLQKWGSVAIGRMKPGNA